MREMVSYLSKYIYFKRVYINQKYFNVLNYVAQIHIQVLISTRTHISLTQQKIKANTKKFKILI